jgi:hypothetical protein
MIIICEPQCKEFSHEKVNSGFIYALRLAYPEEKLLFYAHKTHIEAIRDILYHDNAVIDNIEYMPISFQSSFSKAGMRSYGNLFTRIFLTSLANGTDKIFFLSFSAPILYTIKKLKQKPVFANMKFALVAHRDFENIADDADPLVIHPAPPPSQKKSLSEKINRIKLHEIAAKIYAKLHFYWDKAMTERQTAFALKYITKDMILWENSVDFRYIVLSPHILPNAAKYIDVNEIIIHTVFFPTIFAPVSSRPENEFVKFAIFGFGNSAMLNKVLLNLSKRSLKQKYEIRLISMDTRGTVGFENVTCPSQGKALTRNEMESYATDIDLFLILYDKYSYKVSCSGSIIESLSYMKPILHFKNDCINFFNTSDTPIGICCDNIDDYVGIMEDMINNYEPYKKKFELFRSNILKQRNKYQIQNSIESLKKSFQW